MTVYRVENKEGKGPYCGSSYFDWQTEIYNSHRNPSPIDDGIWDSDDYFDNTAYYSRYYYGFKSMEQYINWFNIENRLELLEKGYVLRRYEVPDEWVVEGYKHLAFNMKYATKH